MARISTIFGTNESTHCDLSDEKFWNEGKVFEKCFETVSKNDAEIFKAIRKQPETAWKLPKNDPTIECFRMGQILGITLKFSNDDFYTLILHMSVASVMTEFCFDDFVATDDTPILPSTQEKARRP